MQLSNSRYIANDNIFHRFELCKISQCSQILHAIDDLGAGFRHDSELHALDVEPEAHESPLQA